MVKVLYLELFCFKKNQKKIKIIYPIHPRTKKQIKKFNLEKKIKKMKNFIIIPPVSYIDMIKLVKESKFLMTDSGGLQEESTFFKTPCLTFRENTERPIKAKQRTSIIFGNDKDKIIKAGNNILSAREKRENF